MFRADPKRSFGIQWLIWVPLDLKVILLSRSSAETGQPCHPPLSSVALFGLVGRQTPRFPPRVLSPLGNGQSPLLHPVILFFSPGKDRPIVLRKSPHYVEECSGIRSKYKIKYRKMVIEAFLESFFFSSWKLCQECGCISPGHPAIATFSSFQT